MTYVLRPAARRDILDYYAYLVDHHALQSAKRFLKAVEITLNHLAQTPAMGTPRKLKNPELRGLRSWPVEGFSVMLVYYQNDHRLLRVIRLLHTKRDRSRILQSHPI